MNNVDLINAIFPFIGSFFIIANIMKLIKDKEIKGIQWWSPLFFYCGQAWGVYFFFSLGQYYSFVGASILLLFNFIWFGLVLYYKFLRTTVNEHK